MRKQTELKCKNCENIFLAKRSDRIYCSNSCRQDAYLKRQANYNGKVYTPEKGKPTIYIMLWLNDLLLIIAKGKFDKETIDDLLRRVLHQEERLFSLSTYHSELRKSILELCRLLQEWASKHELNEDQAAVIQKSYLPRLEILIRNAKTAFSWEFPLYSNSKYEI